MKQSILVVSDTHGSTKNLSLVLSRENSKIDYLIHCGDGVFDVETLLGPHPPISWYGVSGNSGDGSVFPLFRVVEISGIRIFVTHGHYFNVDKNLTKISMAAKNQNCSIICFGHLHVPIDKTASGLYIVNPGSLSRPRNVEGPTYAIVSIIDGNPEIVIKCV